jgi:Mn-dependent DtxR family transcriptional regulator
LDKDELKSRFEKMPPIIPKFLKNIAMWLNWNDPVSELKEISEILDVSQNEAEQMLSLARLSNGRIRKKV